MIISFQINGQNCKVDDSRPIDISIPLKFGGEQPNAYGVEKATSTPCEAGSLIGDTRHGGSCNFEQVKFIPHCNGTHTECVGHITNERISVRECLKDVFVPAVLISVEPELARESKDAYSGELNKDDQFISRKSIENAFENLKLTISDFTSLEPRKAIVIRTLPNDESKLFRTYLHGIPPFFSNEAMKLLIDLGINHLLVDLPTIDRLFDEGKLSNHRIFWNIEEGSFELNDDSYFKNTITELIYVPNSVTDGNYLLNLQIAPFDSDAAPSRPILFQVL